MAEQVGRSSGPASLISGADRVIAARDMAIVRENLREQRAALADLGPPPDELSRALDEFMTRSEAAWRSADTAEEEARAAIARVEPGAGDPAKPTSEYFIGLRLPGSRCWLYTTHANGNTYSGNCGGWGCRHGTCTEERIVGLVRRLAAEWTGKRILVIGGRDRARDYLDAHPEIRLKGRKAHVRSGRLVQEHRRTEGAWLVKGWDEDTLLVPDERGTGDVRVLARALATALLDRRYVERKKREDRDETPRRVTVPSTWDEQLLTLAQEWPSRRISPTVRLALRRPTEDEWRRFVQRCRGEIPVIPPRSEDPAASERVLRL